MELKSINLYRMTHIDNIPHILEYGITHKHSKNKNEGFVAIGDQSLISNRNTKEVFISNGNGLEYGIFPAIRIGEFIPLALV